jgi:hypothetical protein
MKRIWEKPQVEIEHAIIPKEEFDQLLDEWAEIVYRHFCQLQEVDQAEVSVNPMRRTGTDG